MKPLKTPEQRTAEARARTAAVRATPLQYTDSEHPLPAGAPPFQGHWFHSTSARVGSAIVADGWKPDLVQNTIYGAAVFLARTKWSVDHSYVFDCLLDLQDGEGQSEFPSAAGTGNSETHVLWYITEAGGRSVGRNAGAGISSQNQYIKNFFRCRGIKAIHFLENGTEVVAVYEPSCIRVFDHFAEPTP